MLETESSRNPKSSQSPRFLTAFYFLGTTVWGVTFVYAVTHNQGIVAAISLLVTGYLGGVVGRVVHEWIDYNY